MLQCRGNRNEQAKGEDELATNDFQGREGGRETRLGRVIAAYQAAYRDPISVHAGQDVAVGDKESEWPGWLWCTAPDGKSGWVPEAYLARRGSRATVLRDYDAAELSVQAGEALIVGIEESGWFWCTNRAGQSGWVPAEHLELESEA